MSESIVILLLLSCTFCQFSKSSYFQVGDIALTCASQLWAYMVVVSYLPNINSFENIAMLHPLEALFPLYCS